ncbi:MAG: hypothetical protein WCI74_21410, partial [Actinomycetes bacterium]
GKFLRVVITETNGVAPDASATSDPTPAVAGVAPAIASATITGTAKVDSELTAMEHDVRGIPTPALSYQWQIADSPSGPFSDIPGAVTAQFTPSAQHATKFVRVVITATNGVDPHGSTASDPTSAVSHNAKTGAVVLSFIDAPPQIVPGQTVLFNLDVTASGKTLADSSSQRSTAGINGSAVVRVNGTPVCTATIANGLGSCRGLVNAGGLITFTAEFTGTISGVSGMATAQATAVAKAAGVAINRARMTIGRCSVTLTLAGTDAAAGRKVTIWMKQGTRKVKLGVVRSGPNKAWRFTAKVSTVKTTVWVSDGRSTGPKLIVRVLANKDLPTPTYRGC